MPVQCRCQVVPFAATPNGPAPYITTNLVALVKFHATNWLFQGSTGVYAGLNGQTAFAWIPKVMWELGVEIRVRQSPDWRVAPRHSGEWRSRDRRNAELSAPRLAEGGKRECPPEEGHSVLFDSKRNLNSRSGLRQIPCEHRDFRSTRRDWDCLDRSQAF